MTSIFFLPLFFVVDFFSRSRFCFDPSTTLFRRHPTQWVVFVFSRVHFFACQPLFPRVPALFPSTSLFFTLPLAENHRRAPSSVPPLVVPFTCSTRSLQPYLRLTSAGHVDVSLLQISEDLQILPFISCPQTASPFPIDAILLFDLFDFLLPDGCCAFVIFQHGPEAVADGPAPFPLRSV